MKDLNSYRLNRHIGAIQLSFLSDSYTWIENTQVTHTGLDGTNYMHETKLLNAVVARGLRIDFYPTYLADRVNNCEYTLVMDFKFKKVEPSN